MNVKKVWIIAGAVLVVVLIVMTLTPDSDPEDPPPLTACELAFQAAAQISDMQDTVEDLDPAVLACPTVADWLQAAGQYPGAIDADPGVFLANRCRYGPTTAPICTEALR